MRTAAVAKSAEIIVPTLTSMYGQLLAHSSDPNSYYEETLIIIIIFI